MQPLPDLDMLRLIDQFTALENALVDEGQPMIETSEKHRCPRRAVRPNFPARFERFTKTKPSQADNQQQAVKFRSRELLGRGERIIA